MTGGVLPDHAVNESSELTLALIINEFAGGGGVVVPLSFDGPTLGEMLTGSSADQVKRTTLNAPPEHT